MKFVRIPVSDPAALPQLFSSIPAGPKSFLRDGFQHLAAVNAEIRAKAIKLAADLIVESGGPYSSYEMVVADFAAKLNMEEERAGTLLSAVSFTLAIISTADITPTQFADEAVNGLELPADTKTVVVQVAEHAAAGKAVVMEASRLAELANENLPSLAYFGTSIDLRLGFEKSTVAAAVPVLVVHIHTDVDSEEPLSFQMTRRQLEGVVEDLKKALERMKSAELLAVSVSTKKKG